MNRTDNSYAINEEERKKVLDDIKLGICRIEFTEGQPPRIYADANLYEILGAEPGMSPEQLYQYWYGRIEPEYLSYVNKSVERLIKTRSAVEVEYLWNHPYHGKTVVRCDATLSVPQTDGKVVILGTYRDITDKMTNNMWEETGYQIADYYKMTHCGRYLIRAYEEIFLINTGTKCVHPIAYRRDYCLGIQEGSTISDVIARHVFPEDRERVYGFFSDQLIRKIVSQKSSASIDFRKQKDSGRHEWVRGTLDTVQINGTDELLFIVQDIQNEYKLKILKEEKEDVLLSIINEKSVIYEYDTELQQLQILKYDTGNISRAVSARGILLSELAEKLCAHYVDRPEWPEVKMFLSCENISDCVAEKCKRFISFPLDDTHFRYDYIKISALPSSKSETKAYLMIELMNRKERMYPILASYIRDMVDHFYCIDLKTGYFFQLIGNTEAMPPKEGYDYVKAISDYTDRFVLEEERGTVKRQTSPEFILKELEKKQEFSFVESVIGEHGEIRKKLITYRPFDLSKGHVLMQRTDITDMYDRELLLKQAQQEAMTDPLTQLYNRLGCERLIKRALSEIDEKKKPVMILLDLDNFKEVNDRFGHPTGDQVLCEAAHKLRECFRTGDIIGRLGGDEYIIFLPDILHKNDIHPVLERVVQHLNIVCRNETESITVTVSAGATFCNGQSFEELYEEADKALYYSKKKRNSYALFEDMM